LVRGLAVTLIALVCVVIASALERLWLYQQQFGLTELRVYATGVVLCLAVVFAWLAVTVLRGRRHLFATGAVVLGFAATLCLNVLDPDALIARTNVTRPQADVSYLASLSDDAVPTLLARLPQIEPTLRRPLARALLERTAAQESWLSWNRSRSRAASLLAAHRDELRDLSR
jgi:predicted acyltransferase